jgi:hypothetical protein
MSCWALARANSLRIDCLNPSFQVSVSSGTDISPFDNEVNNLYDEPAGLAVCAGGEPPNLKKSDMEFLKYGDDSERDLNFLSRGLHPMYLPPYPNICELLSMSNVFETNRCLAYFFQFRWNGRNTRWWVDRSEHQATSFSYQSQSALCLAYSSWMLKHFRTELVFYSSGYPGFEFYEGRLLANSVERQVKLLHGAWRGVSVGLVCIVWSMVTRLLHYWSH